MKLSNQEIRLCVDMLIVETLLANTSLNKTAQSGVFDTLVSAVKDYVGQHIDENDKTGSFINFIGPGLVAWILKGMGLGWGATLVGLLMSFFRVDLKSILNSIVGTISGHLKSNQPLTSSQVDQVVRSAVNEHMQPATQAEAEAAATAAQSIPEIADQSEANDSHMSIAQELRNAKLFRLAMIEYRDNFESTAAPWGRSSSGSSWLSSFNRSKMGKKSALTTILGVIFKIALGSAGLMLASDVIHHVLGNPNALDGNLKGQHAEQATQSTIPTVVSTQKVFPLKPSANTARPVNWIERITNNRAGIEEMVINFAKETYGGLDGQENNIRETSGFKAIVDNIEWYNHTSSGGPLVFIPSIFTSKKMLVDHFIDEVAQKVKSQ